jgi:hypothetical protein
LGLSAVVDPHLAKNERDVGHPNFVARDAAKDAGVKTVRKAGPSR